MNAIRPSSSDIDSEFNTQHLSFFHTIEQLRVLKLFQKDLYQLTGLPFDFVDLRLQSSRHLHAQRFFTGFCTLINNTHLGHSACEKDDQRKASKCLGKKQSISRCCHLGLIDITIPVVVNTKVIGMLCTGQLFYRKPTEKSFQRIQKKLTGMGVDLSKARKAYFNIPVIEKRQVAAIIDLIQMVVELIDTTRLKTLKTAVHHHPLSKALDFIEAHYAESINLSTVAKEAGLSVSRLAHVFKAQIGMSFTAYLNMIRVNWAKYYLENSQLRVSEMAFHVGFGNLSHFNHVFRQTTGLPPTQYRRQHTSTRK